MTLSPLPAETRNVRTCPACSEEILAVARKCKHCETLFDPFAPPSRRATSAPTAQTPVGVVLAAGLSSSTAPQAIAREDRAVLPRMFASFGALIAIAAGGMHYLAWQSLQELTLHIARHHGEPLPLVPIAASERAWRFYDLVTGAATDWLLSGAIAAGLLMVVSWGLWHHRWWAPRVTLLWSVLVACMLVNDYLLTQQVEDALLSAEVDAIRALVEQTGDLIGVRKEALASIPPVLIPWMDRMFLAVLNAKLDFAFGWALESYVFAVAWFPAAIALLFCRPGARRYFKQRADR
jgi:hypothetical protein